MTACVLSLCAFLPFNAYVIFCGLHLALWPRNSTLKNVWRIVLGLASTAIVMISLAALGKM